MSVKRPPTVSSATRPIATSAVAVSALLLLLAACSGNPPATGAAGASSADVPAPIETANTEPAAVAPGMEADPCELVSRAEAEAQAGASVTVERGVLPGPVGEGSFCRYTSSTAEELEIRTAADRGDFDNDRKLSSANGWDTADLSGLGDAAWSDAGPFLASINVMSHGAWVRISVSSGFGTKPALALENLASQAITRLP